MNVHLIWFGQLRDAAGAAQETVTAEPGATVAGVLSAAASSREGSLSDLLFLGDAVAPTILVSMNDVQVTDPAATELQDGATLVVMAPMSGG